jgi:hypothetical protein
MDRAKRRRSASHISSRRRILRGAAWSRRARRVVLRLRACPAGYKARRVPDAGSIPARSTTRLKSRLAAVRCNQMGYAGTEFDDGQGGKYVMDAHGSITHLGDGTPPGKSRSLLRGNFAIVEYSNGDKAETFVVLQGLADLASGVPNRKIVYRLDRAEAHFPDEDSVLDAEVAYAIKTQDSPGMARDGWARAK